MAVSYVTEVDATGATQTDVTPYRHKVTYLSHESRQCTCREYFMSHTNRTRATQRKQILKISLDQVHLKIKIKNRDLCLSLAEPESVCFSIGSVVMPGGSLLTCTLRAAVVSFASVLISAVCFVS
jgi:hypothetical protein